MNKVRKAVTAALVLVLLLSLTMTAFAADGAIDFNKKGSITVELRENSHSTPLSGLDFTLYKVADIATDNNVLSYTLTNEFADSGVSLDITKANDLAAHLAAYAKQKSIAGTSQSTVGNSITFSDLELGLYLIVENGTVSGYYPTSPFLVSVPMTNAEGTAWIYEINASPKVEPKPVPPTPDTTSLTVKKIWANTGNNIPESVEVALVRNGEIYSTVILNNENDWQYTWNNLDRDYQWTAVETKVPTGFEVSYNTSGKTVTITNTAEPDIPTIPITLTVKKVWDDSGKDRPSSVTVQLYENGNVRETVTLSQANNWMYTWNNLSSDSSWDVKEDIIPKDYTAYYSRTGNTITITNAITLIRTGQLIWPIPVLAGTGIIFFAFGWVLVFAKRKNNEE